MIDDMNDFHGFITPGGKMSSQRLEDECSTALPSMCTTGSLESLPTTPAGWGALMPPPEAGPSQGWTPGAQTFGLGNFGGLPSLDASSEKPPWELPADLDMEHFTSFLDNHVAFPDMLKGSVQPSGSQLSVSELSDALSAIQPSAVELATPPLTPRKERAVDKTCPLAPGNVQEVPILLKALSKNHLDLVKNALESDPHSASAPFWDQDAEPPLCAAIRLGCGVDICNLLIASGADVKAKNIAGQSPFDLLHSATWHTVVYSEEMEDLLLRAGAEPSENSVKLPRDEEVMRSDTLRWDAFADVHTLNDFGLPPSLGSFGLFDIGPPPPVKGMA